MTTVRHELAARSPALCRPGRSRTVAPDHDDRLALYRARTHGSRGASTVRDVAEHSSGARRLASRSPVPHPMSTTSSPGLIP